MESKNEWVDAVAEMNECEWKKYWNEIGYLEQVRIDKWIGTMRDTKSKLNGSSDAST